MKEATHETDHFRERVLGYRSRQRGLATAGFPGALALRDRTLSLPRAGATLSGNAKSGRYHASGFHGPDETLHTAKAKRVRYVLLHVTGRFSRDRRKITLHLAETAEWIKRFIKLFARFPLATQPTG